MICNSYPHWVIYFQTLALNTSLKAFHVCSLKPDQALTDKVKHTLELNDQA